jgi:hypothetical protein
MFADVYSDILSGIISGIYSEIPCCILCGILCGILSDIYSGIQFYVLTFYLAIFVTLWHSIWHFIWQIFRHSIWHLFWHLFWHSLWHARVHACPTASGSCDVVRIDCCPQSQQAGRGIDKEKEEKETEGVVLKSREPDLAGGTNMGIQMDGGINQWLDQWWASCRNSHWSLPLYLATRVWQCYAILQPTNNSLNCKGIRMIRYYKCACKNTFNYWTISNWLTIWLTKCTVSTQTWPAFVLRVSSGRITYS